MSENDAGWHGTASRAWEAAIKKTQQGALLESRVGVCHESIGCQFAISSMFGWVDHPIRDASLVYACGELLWYLSGGYNSEMIKHYAPSYEKFMDDGVAYGAYGPRIMPQLTRLITELSEHPESRRAVIAVYEPRDLGMNKKDIPCTLSLQFILRNGYLNLITTMRSNDVWLGMPYDIFCFTSLQMIVASILNVYPWMYFHNVGSLHLYHKDTFKRNLEFKTELKDSSLFDPNVCLTEADIEEAVRLEAQIRRNPDDLERLDEFLERVQGCLSPLGLAVFTTAHFNSEKFRARSNQS